MTTKTMTKTDNSQLEKKETTRQVIAPAVDVLENENEYLLISDVPGVKAEDVQIDWHNGELTIRAPATFGGAGVDLVSGGGARYEYARRFRIPAGIAQDKITAELTNGVLKLHVPKEEARKPRQIPVRAA
jgi:HSP20 family molecular chaperone IbpA